MLSASTFNGCKALTKIVIWIQYQITMQEKKIHKAWEMFNKMHDLDTISWNVIIVGYTIYGYTFRPLHMLQEC